MWRIARLLATVLLALIGSPDSKTASAQAFPSRPITLIISSSAGSTIDPVNRVVADKVSSIIGQPIVLDYRPGAGGAIAVSALWRAQPDGYTIGMLSNGVIAGQGLGRKVQYDVRDLVPIGCFFEVRTALIVRRSLPVETVSDLVALAKAKPGVLNYGSTGAGGAPHIALEMFNQANGLSMTHVPFNGDTPAYTALIAEQIDVYFTGMALATEAHKAGRARILAVTGEPRLPSAPDIPTFREAGVAADAEFRSLNGWVAPPGTPAHIVQKLSDALLQATQDKDIRERFAKTGIDVISIGPSDFQKIIASDLQRYQALSGATGIRLD